MNLSLEFLCFVRLSFSLWTSRNGQFEANEASKSRSYVLLPCSLHNMTAAWSSGFAWSPSRSITPQSWQWPSVPPPGVASRWPIPRMRSCNAAVHLLQICCCQCLRPTSTAELQGPHCKEVDRLPPDMSCAPKIANSNPLA